MVYIGSVCLWLYSEVVADRQRKKAHSHAERDGSAEGVPLMVVVDETANGNGNSVHATAANGSAVGAPAVAQDEKHRREKEGGGGPASPLASGAGGSKGGSSSWSSSAFYRCLVLEEEGLLACRDSLRAAVEFGTIILWFYVADRTSLIEPGAKVCVLGLAATCCWPVAAGVGKGDLPDRGV